MKVALTGADGMLGHAIQKVFSDTELMPFSLASFDITDLERSVKMLRDTRPDVLIHTAAFTDVDACETDAEKAYRVNGMGARNMAIACEEIRCPILHISSDYVFDGEKETPYNEWDRPNPINHYGISKLLAEQFVSSLTNKFYIVRTSWLYGPNGKNFVDTILRLLAETKELRVVNDQFGSPTFTEDLATAIRQLLGKGYGMYHVTNSGVCSWHECALKIAELKGLQNPILPVTSAEFKRPARRPTHSAMNNTMLRLEGVPALRHWSEALEQYVKQAR